MVSADIDDTKYKGIIGGMRRILKILLVAVLLTLGTITLAYVFLQSDSESPSQAPRKLPNTGSSLNRPVHPATSTAVNQETLEVNNKTIEVEWETYRDEKSRFTIQCPKKGWILTSKVGSSVLSYPTTQEPISCYTQRSVPGQGPISAPITIAVYEKPEIEIVKWLSVSYGRNLSDIQKGDLDLVLARAYAGETGVISYNKSRINDMTLYEVGRVWSNGYAISYATFFVTDNIPYIIEVNFELPYYGQKFDAAPSDNEYIQLYKQTISSFQLTE